MVLSKGLLISLGFTLLIGVLLFMFIKQKTNHIEGKMDALFKLVREEAEKNQRRQLEMKQNNMMISEVSQSPRPLGQSLNEVEEQSKRLITVSDDSDNDESESDEDNTSIEEDSDIESDTENEDEDDGSEQEENPEELKQELLETSVTNLEEEFNSQNGGNMEIKYVKLDQEEGLEGHNIHMMMMNTVEPTIVTMMSNDIKDSERVTLVSDDDEESDLGSDIDELSLSDEESVKDNKVSEQLDIQEPIEQTSIEEVQNEESKIITPSAEFMNYSKLSVKVLREIVSSQGLHPEPSKLKKKELLKILE